MSKNMNKAIIINAPSGTGKDVAAEYVAMYHGNFEKRQFKQPIYEIGAAIYNLTYETMLMLCTDRSRKEKPHGVFDGLSPREALIFVSENVIKPNYGNDYFGRRVADTFTSNHSYVFSDGGFKEEIEGVIKKIGIENVLIIRAYRPGFTFNGDSRNYLDETMLPDVKFIDVNNDSTEKIFKNKIYKICRKFDQGIY